MGILIGSMLNMGLINFGMKLFPLPEGINISTEENFKNAFSYFEFKHFIFPFLGHAIGTFTGAFVCMLLSKTNITNDNRRFFSNRRFIYDINGKFTDLVHFIRYNNCIHSNGLFSLRTA